MENRQRQLIAAVILVGSLVIVGYLIFFTPSESNLPIPTPTTAPSQPIWTQLPSTPESDEKRTAEAGAAQRALTPESAPSRSPMAPSWRMHWPPRSRAIGSPWLPDATKETSYSPRRENRENPSGSAARAMRFSTPVDRTMAMGYRSPAATQAFGV